MNPKTHIDIIHVEIDRAEGTLLRILGLVERRGFFIETMEMCGLGEEMRGLTLGIQPRDPSRRLENLGLQIDRLYGVRRLKDTPDWANGPRPKAPLFETT